MAKIENIRGLMENLRKRKLAAKDANCSVIVGYTAKYALFVHESVGMVLQGIPRDPRLRETPTGRHIEPPRPRIRDPKGLFWDPQGKGQAKFLEEPFRRMKNELIKMVADAVKSGKPLPTALLLAGLRVQRESQKLVPVDTGNLRASAFTRRDK